MPMIARKRRHLVSLDEAWKEVEHHKAVSATLWWIVIAELVALAAQQIVIWSLLP